MCVCLFVCIATQRWVCTGHTKLAFQMPVAWRKLHHSQTAYHLLTFISCPPIMTPPRLHPVHLVLCPTVSLHWHPLNSPFLTSTNMVIQSACLLYTARPTAPACFPHLTSGPLLCAADSREVMRLKLKLRKTASCSGISFNTAAL